MEINEIRNKPRKQNLMGAVQLAVCDLGSKKVTVFLGLKLKRKIK
jgi:hypothetical protein